MDTGPNISTDITLRATSSRPSRSGALLARVAGVVIIALSTSAASLAARRSFANVGIWKSLITLTFIVTANVYFLLFLNATCCKHFLVIQSSVATAS